MKKVLLFMLMALPFVFTSCSDDDDDDFTSADIVGTWTFSKCEASEVTTSDKVATDAIIEDVKDYVDDDVLTFTSDGKFKVNSKEEGTYTINGNKLILTADGDKQENTISISGNRLIVYQDETEYYQDEIEYLIDDADDVKVTKVITAYHYSKQ